MSTPGPPPVPARTPRPTRAATRAALMLAAVRTFGERGYAQTSLEQVAAAAGLSRGAVYSNFANKDELFLALLRETVDDRLRQLGEAVRSAPTARDQAHLTGRSMTEALQQRPEVHLLFMEFWLRAARDPSVREHFMTHRQEIRRAVEELLEQRRAAWDLELPLPASELAVGIIALFNGLGLEQLVDPDAVSPGLFGHLLAALLRTPLR